MPQLLQTDLTAEERARLERELAELEDQQTKATLIRERNLKIASLDMQTYFDGLKKNQDDWLIAQTDSYNADLLALKQLYTDKLADTKEFVKAYNAFLATLLDKTVTITTVHRDVYEAPPPPAPTSPTPPKLPGMQSGGIIPEPTLLYGLRSLRTYAVAGEAGPERVGPVGGGDTIINITMPGTVIRSLEDINELGKRLVDRIRLTTGVRI